MLIFDALFDGRHTARYRLHPEKPRAQRLDKQEIKPRLPKQISGGLYDSYLGRSTTEKAQRGGTVVKSSVTYQRNAVSHLLLTNNFHFELKGIKLAPMAQLSLSLGRFLVPAAHTGKAEQGVVLLPAQLQFPVDEGC